MDRTGEPPPEAPVRTDVDDEDVVAPAGSRDVIDGFWLALVASISVAATLAATRLGPGLTPDSANYLSAADNLADSGRLVTFSGRPLTVFPPGLPLLVAIGDWFGLSGDEAARFVLIVSAVLVVVLSHFLLRQHVRSRFVLWAATVWVAVSPVLLGVERMVWSEAPFIVSTLGLLILIEKIDDDRSLWSIVLGAAALCSVAFTFRYAGLALIPTAGLTIIWMRRRRLPSTILPLATFAVLASIFPLVWTARNRRLGGHSFGGRAPSTLRVLDVAADLKQAAVRWVIPVGPEQARTVLAALLVVAVVGVVMWMVWTGELAGPDPSSGRALIAPIVIFVSVYVGYLFAAQLRFALDVIDDRLLSPVYVPTLVLVAVAVERMLDASPRPARILRIVGMFGFSAYIAGHAASSAVDTRDAYADGLGYAALAPRDSELGLAVRDLPEASLIVTNAPDIYLFWRAARTGPLRDVRSADLSSLAVKVACATRPAYLAWYGPPDDQPSSSDRIIVEAISEHPEGTLSLLSTAPGAAPCPAG